MSEERFNAAADGSDAAAAPPPTAPGGKAATARPKTSFAYDTKFKLWEARSAVRAKPRRVLFPEDEQGRLFFPPELVPLVLHPLVRERGDAAVAELLLQRLYVYLEFTAELEHEAINPVTQRISRRRIGFAVPDSMVEDAYKIYTDEAWHAQFSDDLERQLIAATGVHPVSLLEPQFFSRLREIESEIDGEHRGLPSILFTIISETLISSILCDIPHDERVVGAVREVVADHAEDEGRHHAFFAKFFACMWPQLSTRQRKAIGPLLPSLVLAFLEPDYAALRQILEPSELTLAEIDGVLEESFPRHEVVAAVRNASGAPVRMFEQFGVLDDGATREAFAAAGLVDA
jgi:hypothetical protein